jgi:hypothetical protein
MYPVTKRKLSDEFGVDYKIATFFSDRIPPPNNHFWKGKYVYLSRGLGYIIIPLLFDLQYKLGLERSTLLDEKRIQLMEEGFDIMAKYEAKKIPYEEYISSCEMLFKPTVVNEFFYNDLILHLNNKTPVHYTLGTPVKALNRADAFLFTLCDMAIDTTLLQNIVTNWRYINANALILDDISDLAMDEKKGEENSIIELGNNDIAWKTVQSMFDNNQKLIGTINPTLTRYFEISMTALLQHIQ